MFRKLVENEQLHTKQFRFWFLMSLVFIIPFRHSAISDPTPERRSREVEDRSERDVHS